MARVLITGGNGLIGGWVRHHWPGDLELVQVARTDCDLTEPGRFVEIVRTFEPAVVLHLAWSASAMREYRTSPDNERWVEASIDAATYCLESGIRFFGTGSVVDEGGASDPYSRSKADLRQRLAAQITDHQVGWIRPFHVFDPAADRPAVVAAARRAAAAHEAVDLLTPTSRHDFVHASDVGAAVVDIVRHDLRGSIDIGCGRARSVVELVEACGASWRATPDLVAEPHDGPVADTAALLRLGWKPSTTDLFFDRLPPGLPD